MTMTRLRRLSLPAGLFLPILMISAAVSGATPDPMTCAPDTPARNEATVRIIFEEILSQGRFDENDHIYHAEFVAHGAGGDVGRAEDRAAGEALRRMAPDMRMTVLRVIADCNEAAVYWEATGTNTGGVFGVPANNGAIRARGATFFVLREGQISEEWTLFDQYTMLQQLGALGGGQ
jgi:steroid delta-isomerase-like uncharacterized protein